jgi:hypothetical protein
VLEVEHRPWFTELGKYSTTELYLQPVVRLFYLFIFMGKYFYYLWIRFVKPHREQLSIRVIVRLISLKLRTPVD